MVLGTTHQKRCRSAESAPLSWMTRMRVAADPKEFTMRPQSVLLVSIAVLGVMLGACTSVPPATQRPSAPPTQAATAAPTPAPTPTPAPSLAIPTPAPLGFTPGTTVAP